MASPPFLWMDYRRTAQGAGAFALLQPTWAAARCVRPAEATRAIQCHQPWLLCIEFDTPATQALAALQQTRLQHPRLPIFLLSDPVSPAFAEWVFRLGVWDHLVNPVSAADLNDCIAAFDHFCQHRRRATASASEPCPPPRQTKTQPACAYVAQHYADEVRLKCAASLCHLSESEFSRCFKKENGITFTEYLVHWRLHKACNLLAEPAIQVKTAAFEVGFNDVSYFARAFKHHTGLTPSAYQRTAGFGYHASPLPATAAEALRPQA